VFVYTCVFQLKSVRLCARVCRCVILFRFFALTSVRLFLCWHVNACMCADRLDVHICSSVLCFLS